LLSLLCFEIQMLTFGAQTKNIKFINSPGGAPEPKVIWADDG